MAKQGKRPPARRQRTSMEDSLLLRSAESLGRMIGSLQRQLDGVAKKTMDGTRTKARVAGTRVIKRRKAKASAGARTTSGGTKRQQTAARKRAGVSRKATKRR